MGKSSSHNLDNPDYGPAYAMEIEARPGGAEGKHADLVLSDLYTGREAARNDARLGDSALEAMTGINRAKRDLERAYPRSQVPEQSSRKQRALASEGEFRSNLSSGQRKARSKAKRVVQDSMPSTERDAVARTISTPEGFMEVNQSLHTVRGNARRLSPKERRHVQRIDRALARYERSSDRNHIVYFAASMDVPPQSPSEVPATWQPGQTISLDQYTAAAHTMHEVDRESGADQSVVFEMETSRGMYLGRSDSLDDTRHLLPRGIHAEVIGAHYAPFERPGQSPGDRLVIQLRELNPPRTQRD